MQRLFKNHLLTILFSIVVSATLNTALFAQEPSSKTKTTAELLSEVSSIAPEKTFTVALKLTHPEHWHSYYVNTGLIGEVLETKWTLPEGFTATYQGWPTPHYSKSFGYNTIGYEGTVYHLYTITPPQDLALGQSLSLSAESSWQICDDKGCKSEKSQLSLTLPTSEFSSNNSDTAREFNTARAHYPKPLPENINLSATDDGKNITLTLSGEETKKIALYDDSAQIDSQSTPKIETKDRTTIATFKRNQGNDFDTTPGPVKENLTGVLTLDSGSYLLDLPFSKAAASASDSSSQDSASATSIGKLLPLLASMFFGGLILNLMPCVFPVIGIKIMGFVEQAGHDRKKIMFHGLAFAFGVLASFWILSTIMLLGGIKNWGGQLENPYVMFSLMVVMLLLAMNMYGVFEIGTSATGVGSNLTRKEGLSGSFFSGVLATVVATPCSAPFLGSALGAAVALPTVWFFIAFTIMAIGLSTPYLVLSAFPDLVKKLPRPGAWMESFKQGMSFLLFATVGYLLWVYSSQVFEQDYGQKGLWVMLGLSLIAASAWVWGRWTTPIRPNKTRWIARGLTLALFLTGVLFAKPGKSESSDPTAPQIEWGKWSKEKEQSLLAEGKPVYVDFTAKWCLTCQVNKKNGYPPAVVKAMQEKGVIFLKGDKTTTNPAIDKELKALNRSAIPVNVLYTPEAPDTPHITSEVLTESYMINFTKKHLP